MSLLPEIVDAAARGELPAYAPRMAVFHRACAAELRAILAEVPVSAGDRVLDLACGDGIYATWLAERVGDRGRVVAADINKRFLELAGRRARASGLEHRIELRAADVRQLPFGDAAFDAVWCAHSLYSLPDPDQALAEMRRVARPGGRVAVLENDSLHYLLMPWPPGLELALQEAQLSALRARGERVRKFYIGRRLRGVLMQAGLQGSRVRTFAIDHQAPLGTDERAFLAAYLAELAERTRPYLDPRSSAAFERAIDPGEPGYLLARPDFFTTHLEILACGSKP